MRRLPLLLLAGLLAAGACQRKAVAPARPSVSLEEDQTRPAADWLKIEPVALLQQYVRLETTDAKGEKQGAELLKAFFDCEGIENEIVCPAPERCNLLARLPGRKREGALLLLNHIDVAEASAEMWKDAKPWDGTIKLGYLYGRGAYDMKSLGLAQAFAMRRLKREGIVPNSDILFLAEASEELGQEWGSRWLLEHRPEWFQGVRAVLNEGGDAEMILRTVRFWGIENVQAGYGLIEFESKDQDKLKALASSWEKIQTETVEPLPEVVLGFDMLANHLVHPLTDPLRHLDRVRRNRAELAALPDRYASFLESRIKWFGPFKFPPGAADTFRNFVVVSTPPGISSDRYVEPILKDAAGRAGIRVTQQFSSGLSPASPYLTADGKLTPFLEMIRIVTEGRYPGVPFGPIPTFGGVTTSIYFRRLGIPAYGYPVVPANITDSARRHGNDERIFLRDYLNGLDLYADILEEFALSQNLSVEATEN